MTQTNTPSANIRGFVTILRVAVFIVGVYMQFYITRDLADGSISYSVGEVMSEERTTSSLFDAILLYMAFSPIFIGLILAGVKPRLYIDKPWILKYLIATTAICYFVEGIFC